MGNRPALGGVLRLIDRFIVNDQNVAEVCQRNLVKAVTAINGDIIILPSLDVTEVGYVLGGTASADTIEVDDAADGVIVFGKGGGDTINVKVATDGLLIGGITPSDNFDRENDGIPDSGINKFDYSTLFSGTKGLAVTLNGNTDFFAGGDGLVKEDVSTPTLNNVLFDVGSFTGSAGDDRFLINGGGYSVIKGGAGNDGFNIRGAAKIQSLDAGAGSDTINLLSPSFSSFSYNFTNAETINGSTGDDTITITGSQAATISGGLGADRLTGGTESDIFAFSSILDSVSGNGDIISNFEARNDEEDISLVGLLTGTFAFLTSDRETFSAGGNTEARFTNSSELLEIDADGNGTADLEMTLLGVNLTDLNAADFTVT